VTQASQTLADGLGPSLVPGRHCSCSLTLTQDTVNGRLSMWAIVAA
jgi:hypothetical protein